MSSRPPFVHHSTSYASHHIPHLHPSEDTSSTQTPYKDEEEFSNEKTRVPYPPQDIHERYTYRREERNGRLSSSNCERGGGRLGRVLIFGWVITTVMFIVATAFWKGELFRALDDLSKTLREMDVKGQTIFAFLIFLTTIPPLPLYSTLMVLSGYTFGAGTGFIISYLASLFGALVVFLVARFWLKDCITRCLSSSPTSMSLLAIIPAKPHLLLLIRIAPYPYNLLNVILASSPGLSLKTYMGCTAISLLKVILHTWFGSGIHDISELHRHNSSGPNRPDLHHHHHHSNQSIETMEFNGNRENIKVYWTWGGLILCVVLFFYLHHVAKKAIERAQADVERENRLEEGQVMVTVGR